MIDASQKACPAALLEIPEQVREFAFNLFWSWNQHLADGFLSISREISDSRLIYNPIEALWALAEDPRFGEVLSKPDWKRRSWDLHRRLHEYLAAEDTWYDGLGRPLGERSVVYLSMEFGIHESLPTYSGGLGLLAGDHLKSASDLGLPLVGVGLLYRQGYVHQRVDATGHQQDHFEDYVFERLPIRALLDAAGEPLTIKVPVYEREVVARVWLVNVGRVSLYLLDADIPQNTAEDREITRRLYGGDNSVRIRQELLLGMGAPRLLDVLGVEAACYHLNEGHAAFCGLELLKRTLAGGESDLTRAISDVQRSLVFTTHTPVPAGHDRFAPDLLSSSLSSWLRETGLEPQRLLELGADGEESSDLFNMSTLALKTSRRANGVSQLHGRVSRNMFHWLWPDRKVADVPIGAITNGVHAPTWIAPPMDRLFTRALGDDWRQVQAQPARWQAIDAVEPEALWGAHQTLKRELIELVRHRERRRRKRNGCSQEELNAVDSLLDPSALLIGFARRFAPYKRATLVLSDIERIAALVSDQERPVQLVFAGKSHPRNEVGKEILVGVDCLTRQEPFAGRLVFIEDYDIEVGRALVRGVDVWLNTPRRPYEASGTSGMKAAMNGVPSLSTFDGWWCEGYRPDNGWVIGDPESTDIRDSVDSLDAESLYEQLENQVVPSYYDRDDGGIPQAWVERMKAAIVSCTTAFNSDRMVREYFERAYWPPSG